MNPSQAQLDIAVSVNKTQVEDSDYYTITLVGVCEGETFNWEQLGFYTLEGWAAVEFQQIAEFKRKIGTQF